MFASIATAPAKQSVSETISVLSGRLSSATLLEDRRAAILGLRSFAKEYPASVSSGALRSLIGCLAHDGEDVDTVKVVLETLLMLFSPNEDSPEASEEIALWLADEFTQRLENITLLLDFLETNDFYSRLYSLQLLSAILAARTERTEECIFTAPLGISRLVAILDDNRDVIRSEAITLLTYLTPSSLEIQKLVAFENAFERIFKIIEGEGGVAEGGRVVEDCLILLANLLRMNPHNQTLFRESLCTAVLSRILGEVASSAIEQDEMAGWAQAQRNRNVYALLAVVRLFLMSGAVGTVQNQAEFWRTGLLYHALQLVFIGTFEVQIRAERAIDGHNSGADETANVFTTLLRSPTSSCSSDPYRQWFAAVIMLHLLYDNSRAKALAMTVTEGDEASGEEVVTSIQTVTAQLLGSISREDDPRIAVGYLMLLICWLFEDLDGVNDFLGEGSNVQGLIQVVVKTTGSDIVVQGLCALLLGVVYEFSTKDSPILRQKLHEVLMGRMGRDRYVDRLTKLRAHPWLRDFEVTPQRLDLAGSQRLPDVYFDITFVNFFKDNYSRLLRAIDRDPGTEISFVANGVQQGISRELVDSLRAELGQKDRILGEAQERLSSLENALGQERSDHKRSKETAAIDLSKAKAAQDLLSRKHEEQMQQTRAERQKEKADWQRQMEQARKAAEADAARAQRRFEAEMADLRATSSRLEVDLLKANKSKSQELQSIRETHKAQLTEAEATAADAARRIKALEGKVATAEKKAVELREALETTEEQNRELAERLDSMEKDTKKVEALLVESKEEKKTTQAELDDLLMVFADLEEKANGYRERLKELGEHVSDDENDEEDGDSDEDDSGSESSDEEGWLDTNPGDDEEPQVVISLLDDHVFQDAAAMLSYCKDEHKFDFLAIRDRLGLDFYGCVKLINFIRQRVHEGLSVSNDLPAADFDHDQYLKPVLDNDALIFCLDSLPAAGQPHDQVAAEKVASTDSNETGKVESNESLSKDVQQKNEVLQSELETLTKQFENYRLAVQKTLDQRWGTNEPETDAKSSPAKDGATKPKSSSDYYFESYSYNDIHETMLKDAVRTDAYRDFIYGHKHLFAGKTVLDIGCGTGILSMFCAKAGAKLVIAVDRSEIINKARENIFNNGLSDQITCLKGLIEEVELPVPKVDIIVSEWMGYALLYEAMLPSVIYARDKYLVPGGLLVPSHASLWVAPVCDSEYVCDSITFWRDVYGFDMKAMQAGIYDDARAVVMPSKNICGTSSMFRLFDLHKTTVSDLVFGAGWKTSLYENADSLDGFLVWFDIYFCTSQEAKIEPADATAQSWLSAGKDRVAFTTGPFSKATHWNQCLLLLESHSKQLGHAKGLDLSGEISFAVAPDNPRALTLRMSWTPNSASGEASTQKQAWALN
ncbi:arginine methyltransferase [Grosmannia clavigera kw1407]|uniref:type I protein arginine methyltransferase n=1 Tax=Grosmannia clavigera (strain kw1407 / UAMH 11150) TaxID=655863 RepID=F0XTD2_GROCL|nr:arginine methyltransferase [Grosmannia clavigera kw1407]EFW98969.1 arginine methyltransferase [Grosmannia clavigera kw1407]